MSQHVWTITPVHFATLTPAAADIAGNVPRVTWFLQPPNEFEFECSLDDPGLAALTPNQTTEVALYLDGNLLMVGRPVTRRANHTDRKMTILCKDPMWYYTRRYIGRAKRHNYLTNGDFEAGTTGWTANGTGLTFTTDTDIVNTGTRAAKLVGTAVYAANRSISQQFVATSPPFAPFQVNVSAWFYVETFTDPAAYGLGLLFAIVGGSGPLYQDFQLILADTPTGVWQRASASVVLGPGVTETLQVDLFAIGGTIRWDTAGMFPGETLGFLYGFPGVNSADQANVIKEVLLYGEQQGSGAALAAEKSDLLINISAPDTGVLKQRIYQLEAFQRIYEGGAGNGAVDEFTREADGVDLDFNYTTRTVSVVFPQKGNTIATTWKWHYDPGVEPAAGDSYVIVGWDYGDSIEATANDVTELGGWGSGGNDPTREDGGYENPASLGGLTLEHVESAPQGLSVDGTQKLADSRGAMLENPIVTPTLKLAEVRDPTTDAIVEPLIGVVFPGDTVTLDVADGAVVLAGSFRIAALELDGATEVLTCTVNPA